MTFIGEACVRIDNAEAAIVRTFESLRSNTVAQSHFGSDFAFDFDSSKALIRAEHEVLWIRVEADEIAICTGTKMLIEATIRGYAESMPTCVLWVEGVNQPFQSIMSFEKP